MVLGLATSHHENKTDAGTPDWPSLVSPSMVSVFVGRRLTMTLLPPANKSTFNKKFYICSDATHTHIYIQYIVLYTTIYHYIPLYKYTIIYHCHYIPLHTIIYLPLYTSIYHYTPTIVYHYRRKFRSQTSDNMDRWKAEQGRGREKRKIIRKKSKKKEDADAWKR